MKNLFLMTTNYIINSIEESNDGLTNILNEVDLIAKIECVYDLIFNTISNQSMIFSYGNGGSMCDAVHFPQELSCRFTENKRGLLSLNIFTVNF